MEDEAFFLFVVHQFVPMSYVLKDGKETYPYSLVIKRVCIQKTRGESSGMLYKRIQIDFDPSKVQVAYVLAVRSYQESHGVVHHSGFEFAGIMPNEAEANEFKTRLEAGENKQYVVKKHKFEKVEIFPVLVSKA